MKLVAVDSSMLYAVGYDAASKELEAVYNSGAIWRYTGIPRRVYRELLASDSKGQYMRENVIDIYPGYPVSRQGRRR